MGANACSSEFQNSAHTVALLKLVSGFPSPWGENSKLLFIAHVVLNAPLPSGSLHLSYIGCFASPHYEMNYPLTQCFETVPTADGLTWCWGCLGSVGQFFCSACGPMGWNIPGDSRRGWQFVLGPLISVGNSLLLCFVASYCLMAGFPEGMSQADKIRSWTLGRPGLGSYMIALLSCSGGHSRSQRSTALILPREGQQISTFQREK